LAINNLVLLPVGVHNFVAHKNKPLDIGIFQTEQGTQVLESPLCHNFVNAKKIFSL